MSTRWPVAPASAMGLPPWYDEIEVFICDEPVSVDVELCRRVAEAEATMGFRPTTLFRRCSEHPGQSVLANPYPRPVLLASLGVTEGTWLKTINDRLCAVPAAVDRLRHLWEDAGDLRAMPVVRHRPGDASPYITAAVTETRSVDGSVVNLGVYRLQVRSPNDVAIFFDPRTDAARLLEEHLQVGEAMPVTCFVGAHPAFVIVGASRFDVDLDDYRLASTLAGEDLAVDTELGVPLHSSWVVTGTVSGELTAEGPFAEFKGYYVDARESPVFRAARTLHAPGGAYPTIVTGRESGLALSILQNELTMYRHLRGLGFDITHVEYPTSALGDFAVLVVTPDPSSEVLDAAMSYDRRAKIVGCAAERLDLVHLIATRATTITHEPYVRKGRVEGSRLGLLFDGAPPGSQVEF